MWSPKRTWCKAAVLYHLCLLLCIESVLSGIHTPPHTPPKAQKLTYEADKHGKVGVYGVSMWQRD